MTVTEQDLTSPGDRYVTPTSISPMGLLLDFSAWRNKDLATCELDNTIDGLVSSLYAQHKHSAHRPVSLMWWRNLFPLFSAADATHLMFLLGRRFRLCMQSSREYCVKLPAALYEADHLALLKGLGFNQLMLSLSGTPEQNKVPRDNALNLRGFNFRTVILSIDLPSLQACGVEQLLASIEYWRPDRVIVENTGGAHSDYDKTNENDNDNDSLDSLHYHLSNNGFVSIGNQWYVRPEDELLSSRSQMRINQTLLGYNSVNVKDVICWGIT